MRYLPYFLLIILAALMNGCKDQLDTESVGNLDISLNTSNQSETPNLFVSGDTIYIVWTVSNQDTTILYYSMRTASTTIRTTEVARGVDWFVNWADFSSLSVDPYNPNRIITHWLEKKDTGTYDYDIKISTSSDGGRTWSKGQILHDDGVAAEHGFVSIVDYDKDHFYASWLDGRKTKTSNPTDSTKKLPMTIRGGLINKTTRYVTDFEIDDKVCDCCQTASVKTNRGILTAYRDRSDDEVRDIAVYSALDNTKGIPIYNSNDGWHINGCPVNGPALAANERWTAMAWYTAADSAEVKLTYGRNNTFDQNIKIDNGNPLGRVDIEIYSDTAYVSWLEMKDQRAEIRIKSINMSDNKIIKDQLVTYTSAERRSGFPILKVSNNHLYLAHTEVLSADRTTIRLKQIKR